MSRNTETIIRDHLQANLARQDSIDFAEIASRLDTAPARLQQRPAPHRVWLVTAAAVVLTVLAFGFVPLLFSGDGDPQPADTPAPTTAITVTPPTTDAPPPPSDARPYAFTEIPFEQVSPIIGDITWTRVEGDADTLPHAVARRPDNNGPQFYRDTDGTYVIVEAGPDSIFPGDRTWRSTDGITWTPEDGIPEHGVSSGLLDKSYRVDNGEWRTGSGFELIRATDGGEQTFVLPEPPRPEYTGIEFEMSLSRPFELAGKTTVFVAGNWVGSIPWEDYYGTTTDCSSGQCVELPPDAEVVVGGISGDWHLTIRLWDPANGGGGLIATLDGISSGSEIVFTDQDTGQVVHRVVASSPELIDEAIEADGLCSGCFPFPAADPVAWIGSADEPFTLVPNPPASAEQLLSLPNGGVAIPRILDRNNEGSDVDMLISTDGIEWITVVPNWMNDDVKTSWIGAGPDALTARVRYSDGWTRWATTDGVTWELLYSLPDGLALYENELGLFTLDIHYDAPVRSPKAFVSIDGGDTWAQIPGPPLDEYRDSWIGDPYWETWGIADDLIWHVVDFRTSDGDIHLGTVLWVGKLGG